MAFGWGKPGQMKSKPAPKAAPAPKAKKPSVKKKLANPGERSKLPASALSPQQRQQRQMNQRLDAPIANLPGTPYKSSTTERQLAHQANAATTVQFGGDEQATKQALAQAVQHQQNVGSYYDDYRNQLQSLQGQAQAFNAGAAAAAQNLPGMVTGLAGQTQQTVQQNQAARGPEQGAIGAQTTATDASNAAAVGQSTAAALGANQALLGGVQQTYLGQLANNVAPAQKIQAVNQAQTPITNAQSDIKTLKQKEGAYNSSYRQNARDSETKNLLAGATLNLNTGKAQASNDVAVKNANTASKKANAAIAAEQKRHATAVANSKTSADRAAETARHNRAMEAAKKTADATKADKAAKGKGPNWRTPEQSGSALSDAVTLKGFAVKARKGEAFVQGHPRQAPLTRSAAAAKIKASTPKSIDPAIMSAVLDAAYVGHLSPYTVRKLIAAGFKPSQVSDALGTPTRTGMKNGTQNAQAPGASKAAANAVKKVF